MSSRNVPLLLAVLWLSFSAIAAEKSAQEAQTAVTGWLKLSDRPLGAALSHQVKEVKTHKDQAGTAIYHIVVLQPSGFIVVSAHDGVEPIVAFTASGAYDPSPAHPMGALVSRDLTNRTVAAGNGAAQAKALGLLPPAPPEQGKWERLLQVATASSPVLTSAGTISDVRVAPLVQSLWDQDTVGGNFCYNYYTPKHYVCGCVATAMAQLMRYYQYPTTGVGTATFQITVDFAPKTASLRGGDGAGGPYDWSNMPLVPDSVPSLTTAQRQAIGALCYDAGVAVSMDYESIANGGSGAYMSDASTALKNVFYYASSIDGAKGGYDIGSGLIGMLNPNLDAGLPALLGIYGSPGGHAVVCDGYGYSSSTLYHHLNMGWSGSDDVWYALPIIDTSIGTFDTITDCLYNIFTSGSGEIVSGRVTASDTGQPMSGVAVTANGTAATATTNSNGIYALQNLASNTSYTIAGTMAGFSFTSRNVKTGSSQDNSATAGNVWGADLAGASTASPAVTNVTSSNHDGAYGVGQVIGVTVTFSKVVNVTGTPQLTLATGGAGTAVNYSSGSGTATLTFNYTVLSGDNTPHLDYASADALTLNGGTIQDVTANNAVLTLPAPGTAGSLSANKNIVIDTVAPAVTDVSSSAADGTYHTGQVIGVTVTFSKVVNVTGTPQLTLAAGGAGRAVNYSSGSGTATLTFNYTVAAGDNTPHLDYSSANALALNGGTIQDAAGNGAVLTLPAPGAAGSLGANKNIAIDTAAPTVTNVSSTVADGAYCAGAVIPVTVTFSKVVNATGTPQLTLATGGAGRAVNYSSGSGAATLAFNYTVMAGDNSPRLDYAGANALTLNGGTVQDAAGNNALLTLPAPGTAGSFSANKNIAIDTVAPTVTNVSSTVANGPYSAGAVIPVTLTFSKAVNVTGTPRLALATGGAGTAVNYGSGSGTATLTFNYTVAAGDSAPRLDYASANALTLNGGTIQDVAGNNAVLTLTAPGTAGSLSANKNIVLDTAPPTVSYVSSSSADGAYHTGQVIALTVAFSEVVNVAGTPQLTLAVGGGGRTVDCSGGSGTAMLTFSYTVAAGENTPRLDYSSANALTLNGGGIQDAAGNNAVLTLAPPGSAGSLSASKNLAVNGTAPTISGIASQNIQENGTTGALGFTIGDVDTPVDQLGLAAASSDLALVPAANIVFGGSGANRTVTVAPAANQSGSCTITITVSDPDGLSGSSSFALTVSPASVAPEFQSQPTLTPARPVAGQMVTAQADAGSATITWDFGDGTQVSGGSATHVYTQAGSYTVTATATSAAGLATTWQTQVVVGLSTVGGVGILPSGFILVGGPGLGAQAGGSAKLACNYLRRDRTAFTASLGTLGFPATLKYSQLAGQPGALTVGQGALAQSFPFTMGNNGRFKAAFLPGEQLDLKKKLLRMKIAGSSGLTDLFDSMGGWVQGATRGQPLTWDVPVTLQVGNLIYLNVVFRIQYQQIGNTGKGSLAK